MKFKSEFMLEKNKKKFQNKACAEQAWRADIRVAHVVRAHTLGPKPIGAMIYNPPCAWECILGTQAYPSLKVQILIKSIKLSCITNVGLHIYELLPTKFLFQWAHFEHQFLIHPNTILDV